MDTVLQCELPARAESIGEARRAVRRAVQEICDDETVAGLLLIASELATNAVTHARSAFRLRVISESVDRGHLVIRLEVADDEPSRPVLKCAGPGDVGGRGLKLVEQVSDRWGVEVAGAGKRVYAEVNC